LQAVYSIAYGLSKLSKEMYRTEDSSIRSTSHKVPQDTCLLAPINKHNNLTQTCANTGRAPALTNHPPCSWEPIPWIRPQESGRSPGTHPTLPIRRYSPTIGTRILSYLAAATPAALVSPSVPVSLSLHFLHRTAAETDLRLLCLPRSLGPNGPSPSLARMCDFHPPAETLSSPGRTLGRDVAIYCSVRA
jgi:hypothetical protein